MKVTQDQSHVEKRLILRLRLYFIVMLVIFATIAFEVLDGNFAPTYAVIGGVVGLGVGVIVSRRFHLSWDAQTNNVIANTDLIGAVVLVCYLGFVIGRPYMVGLFVEGAPFFAVLLGLTAGTMLGRIVGTEHGIHKLLRTVGIDTA